MNPQEIINLPKGYTIAHARTGNLYTYKGYTMVEDSDTEKWLPDFHSYSCQTTGNTYARHVTRFGKFSTHPQPKSDRDRGYE